MIILVYFAIGVFFTEVRVAALSNSAYNGYPKLCIFKVSFSQKTTPCLHPDLNPHDPLVESPTS
jgi:hypothetical protein